MHRILFISHSPILSTGYGRVIRKLAETFHAAGANVSVLGFGYRGEPNDLPYPVLPCPHRIAGEWVARAIDQVKPDVLFTLGDPWMFDFLPVLPQRKGLKWIAYFPVDGQPLPDLWCRWIREVDVPVVFSSFTRDLVQGLTGITPQLIYHGVDRSVFRPEDKASGK